MKLSKTVCSLAIAALAGFAGFAHAQWKPTKPIEMIVHTAPGGGNDLLARAMVQMLDKENLLPVRMQVLNRPGGNGAVAAAAIAQFVGFVGAGAGPAGHDRPSAGPTFEQHFGFNGGGPAGIEDLPGHNGVNYKVEGVEHEGAPSSCLAEDPMGHPRPLRCANGHR